MIFAEMNATLQASQQLAATHYENFPVASLLLPKHLRAPIAIIYQFARQADDIADEGDADEATRLAQLQAMRDELDLIQAYIQPNLPLFKTLSAIIRQHQLPVQLFYDLLDAFSQDVSKTRYANFAEVLDYCRRSANPIGRLLLHLYQHATPQNLSQSDAICTALQLINFYQDVAIDLQKNNGKQRIYLSQDELKHFNIIEQTIEYNDNFEKLMQYNLARAQSILNQGKPLGRTLKGRIGLEMRLIIAGGQCILSRLKRNPNVFSARPTLRKLDWPFLFLSALFSQ